VITVSSLATSVKIFASPAAINTVCAFCIFIEKLFTYIIKIKFGSGHNPAVHDV